MKFEPLANRVILEEIEEGRRVGSLFVPDVARKNKAVAFGVVTAVGPGRVNAEGKVIPCHVKVGDTVLYPRQAPAVLPLMADDGTWRDVLLLPENDVIAVVHDLPRQSAIAGLDGAFLSIAPQSMARPDVAYKNEDDAGRSIADLKQSGAPPDVIADVAAAYRDDV